MNSTQARAALDQVMKNIAKAIDNGLHPDKAMDSAALILRESNPELPPLFWFSPEIADLIRREAGAYYIRRHILNRTPKKFAGKALTATEVLKKMRGP